MHSVEQRVITAEAAQAVVAAAIAKAAELGIRVNAAVVDRSGILAAFLRMPGAFVPSVDIAIDKAYTAAGFGFSTAQWPGMLRADEGLRLGMPQRPRNVVFGGGLPIREEGELIGGVGVSGGSAEQDEACARAGLAAIHLDSPAGN